MNPVEACGTSRIPKRTYGIIRSQSCPSSATTRLNICLSVWLNLSTRPSVCGWKTEVLSCCTWRSRQPGHEGCTLVSQDFLWYPDSAGQQKQLSGNVLGVRGTKGNGFRVPGGVVQNNQDVLMTPGRLWQQSHQNNPDPLEGHIDDG